MVLEAILSIREESRELLATAIVERLNEEDLVKEQGDWFREKGYGRTPFL